MAAEAVDAGERDVHVLLSRLARDVESFTIDRADCVDGRRNDGFGNGLDGRDRFSADAGGEVAELRFDRGDWDCGEILEDVCKCVELRAIVRTDA